MTHTFRVRKTDGTIPQKQTQTRRPRENNRNDTNSDLEQLPKIDYNHFDQMEPAGLLGACQNLEINYERLQRHEVLEELLIKTNAEQKCLYGKGILEIVGDGWGFLRQGTFGPSTENIYVSQSQIKRFGLKVGDLVFGQVRSPKDGEKYRGMLRVESVNSVGTAEQAIKGRKDFEQLTPIFPDKKLKLETQPDQIAARIIDLIAPIGKGQRGLIVAPPKTGKTTIIKAIAQSIAINHPHIHLMVVLVDERPEEVTDIRRFVKGHVYSSTFDEPAENHMRVANLCLERAKRMVETGIDVVILLDSLTRLARASNLVINPSGRTLSGGLDPAALYQPRKFFGSARNIEEGGSLTIIATILTDTGSRMDEAILEEFKGTGNMDIFLNRDLAEHRVWPPIDIKKSSTRHEEKLFEKGQLEAVIQLHRLLANQENTAEATESLIKLLKKTPNNNAFLEQVVSKTRSSL